MPKKVLTDLTGKRIGWWFVLNRVRNKGDNTMWLCRCICGTERPVAYSSLSTGGSTSCGCVRNMNPNHVKHGHCRDGKLTPEYNSWSGILKRCNDPNQKCYRHYGGRGIKVRFSSFVEFISEVGPKPSDKHSIDRINADGHYEHGNVRWATPAEQRHNRSRFAKY
jgi:hypothetical protein